MSKLKAPPEEVATIRNELTLSISNGPQPFCLVGDEVQLCPEDWAWFFLRLNQDYRKAYATRSAEAEATSSNGSTQLATDPIKADYDGSCASRFGLGAWLDPSTRRLPKLSHQADSWFFPLTRPIAEDYRRQEVSGKKYMRTNMLYSQQLDRFAHLVANETAFGYRHPITFPNSEHTGDCTMSLTWVAIDCSIPPDGQIAALRALAHAHREVLMLNGWKTHDELDGFSNTDVTKSEIFQHMRFERSAGLIEGAADISTAWQAVQVDALGPIVSQTTSLLKSLKLLHKKLIASGFAQPPPFQRFRNTLPAAMDHDRATRHGGSYLKALLIIAELTRLGQGANGIAKITGVVSESGRHLNVWRREFHEDLDQYIEEAEKMVVGGYKMLIHAQKPSAGKRTSPSSHPVTSPP